MRVGFAGLGFAGYRRATSAPRRQRDQCHLTEGSALGGKTRTHTCHQSSVEKAGIVAWERLARATRALLCHYDVRALPTTRPTPSAQPDAIPARCPEGPQ